MACIAGGIAEAHYGKPPEGLAKEAFRRLDNRLRTTVSTFMRKYVDRDFSLDVHDTATEDGMVSLMGTIFSS